MKLHYAKYPANGFGNRNNQYYLIDVFGNRFDIIGIKDEVLNEVFWTVNDPQRLLNDCGHAVSAYTAESAIELIERLNELDTLAITEW